MADQSRRHALLEVDLEIVIELAKVGAHIRAADVYADGLPADARVIRFGQDYQTGRLVIVLESATFSPVPLGAIPPTLPAPQFRRVEYASTGQGQ